MGRQQQPWRPGQKRLGWRAWTTIGAGTFVAATAVGLNAESTETTNTAALSTAIPASTAAPATTDVSPPPGTQTRAAAPVHETAPSQALAALAALPVKGRAPKTGYDRELFGQSWSDDVSVAGGHNGCDTRNDILNRDLTSTTHKAGTRNCVVLTGTLNDPYTGTVITFQRGQDTSTAVQIDHVVALSDAWQKGAQQLSADERQNFANDPRNLLAVDGPANQQKGNGDAATWLPANKAFRCQYVTIQIEVKTAYRLWITQPEKDAMARVLNSCTDGPAVTPSAESTTSNTQLPPPPRSAPEPTTAPDPPIAPPPTQASVYYANCAAARAAGAAPLHRGDPGYSAKLDRDNDGVACE
ncbi:DUF1524 domain-containing protein [Nocardia cyriacigeorgica]|uniref:DUF1524 domain-containing protein n=1 Tax=Nocardia cyriacigeorgica TaxID=135487 RepID=A0A6P1CNE0_9NOCA|nr:DUF1524 domain-containing protein [Nocardia cyriacigeorgica]NEW32696.1 DUF1524 domain-containing protein [Nocardia cyriacigeorgica]PPJ03649.1 deoxyribonuclease [Nocardia cyriacigeorgica]